MGAERAPQAADVPAGSVVALRNAEFNLLLAFLSAPQRVLAREHLLTGHASTTPRSTTGRLMCRWEGSVGRSKSIRSRRDSWSPNVAPATFPSPRGHRGSRLHLPRAPAAPRHTRRLKRTHPKTEKRRIRVSSLGGVPLAS